MRTLLLFLLLTSSASAATYRPVGYVTINGKRVLVVERKSTERKRVAIHDPLAELWAKSTPATPAKATPRDYYRPSEWTPPPRR